MSRIARIGYRLGASFWFLPALIVAGATALAFVAIEADARYVAADALGAWPRLFGAGPSASRSLLTAVAGSMITVAGTVFSITLVALSLASTQYSPRVLRNFMGDRTNQAVLGVFVGIFAYCLVVLRSIHGEGDESFLPSVAVLLGLLLGFGGIGVLVFFIHHIAQSIQASHILDAVRRETLAAIDRLFPNAPGDAACVPAMPGAACHEVRRAAVSGYLQYVDHERLASLASENALEFVVHPRIGDYIVEGDRLLSSTTPPPDGLGDACGDAWAIGPQRTLEQDVGFGIRQVVDVALKALSPGINDTTTAVMCIDTLSAVLARLVVRDLRFAGCQRDTVTWVHAPHPRFDEQLDKAFDEIRRAARGDPVVLDRIRRALHVLAQRTDHGERRAAIARAAARLREAAVRDVGEPEARGALIQAIGTLVETLDTSRRSP